MPEFDLDRREISIREVEELAREYRTWGNWGAHDELGSANFVTQDTIAAAAGLIRRGASFALALPLGASGPQPGTGRINPQRVTLVGASDPVPGFPRQGFTDDAVYMPLQAATQWDGLCHVFFDGQTHNGRGVDSVTSRGGAQFNSITNLVGRATGRGVLLDVPRFLGRDWLKPGECIRADLLEACASAQGVEVGRADFVLVRTGHLAEVRHSGSWGDYAGGPAPGLGVSAASFFCPREVTAVATDTWGVEVRPYETSEMIAPLHVVMLMNAGIYLGEMWDMEALAADCARDGVYEFFLTAQPLTVTGAVGSPVTPIAIK